MTSAILLAVAMSAAPDAGATEAAKRILFGTPPATTAQCAALIATEESFRLVTNVEAGPAVPWARADAHLREWKKRHPKLRNLNVIAGQHRLPAKVPLLLTSRLKAAALKAHPSPPGRVWAPSGTDAELVEAVSRRCEPTDGTLYSGPPRLQEIDEGLLGQIVVDCSREPFDVKIATWVAEVCGLLSAGAIEDETVVLAQSCSENALCAAGCTDLSNLTSLSPPSELKCAAFARETRGVAAPMKMTASYAWALKRTACVLRRGLAQLDSPQVTWREECLKTPLLQTPGMR